MQTEPNEVPGARDRRAANAQPAASNAFPIRKLTVCIVGWQPAATGKADAVDFAGF